MVTLLVLCFLVRNVPWHLDDYDQAKQAYTSYEMVHLDHWFFQHTPVGKVATKPPLVGWVSAAIHGVTGSWDVAWRLPSLVAALVMLGMVVIEGRRVWGAMGAVLATAFFGMNILAVRLATLVRTDMVLALWIFLVGWVIFDHLRSGNPWTARQRWLFLFAMLASMLTKGPILFAFIVPGLVAFWWLTRKQESRPTTNPGWLLWLLPLGVFLAWAIWGAVTNEAFYQEVVWKEFLGRFGTTESGSGEVYHKSQPVYYYLKVIGLTAPWSLMLIGLLCTKRVRGWLRDRPEVLWLLCWGIGGFVLMSLIPSKRTDRIFPVIPPLAIALPYLAAAAAGASGWWQRWHQRLIVVSSVVVTLAITGYTAAQVKFGIDTNQRVLVDFGAQAREIAGPDGVLLIVEDNDEAIPMYAGETEFTPRNAARKAWKRGEVDVLILPHKEWTKNADRYSGAELVTDTGEAIGKNGRHVLIRRAE
ncbi:ArnT family glycosyltransferase [Sulfuriroseicoccus oceanibius]|uniref:Glycosyltransferase family 39 protein n=1 Tax=Sulfuriroseicoccus oceanibius TaxID=2707525 RepID=A0A6B3LFQ3_9BACT|nr:glycosyltransferase family 39 protein [Sulfuriroseicoccus oceanibius]QQL44760.1 glycosyltransferase family 39 protein [Sulfuriroseicoccus oceanibius]